MYHKPRLERFGTFRELTLSGFGAGGDGCIVLDPVTGVVVDGDPTDGVHAPFCTGFEPGQRS